MIVQQPGETRFNYELRALKLLIENGAGEITVDYDGTTCDGYCLFEEICHSHDLDPDELPFEGM